jgi:pilus assembly protein CpaB
LNLSVFKNRTVIGLICIALSLLICFGLTPLLNSASRSQTEIVRITNTVNKGDVITANELETVKVGKYNLPGNVVKSKADAVGKYATADLQKGDYILSTKLSGKPLSDDYLSELDGTKQAMSITIKSFAAGLSGKLEPGDIISLISTESGNTGVTVQPSELQYVKVLAVTTATGTDEQYASSSAKSGDNGNSQDNLPSTITLLVNSAQANILDGLEQNGNLHVTLVYRGSEANAEKFLTVQDQYFKSGSTDENSKPGTSSGEAQGDAGNAN